MIDNDQPMVYCYPPALFVPLFTMLKTFRSAPILLLNFLPLSLFVTTTTHTTHTRAKGQGERSLGSKVRVEQTDGQTD